MAESRQPVLSRASFLFLLLLLSLLLVHPLRAQTSAPSELDTPPDPGTDVDPSLLPLDSTLGDPVELYIGDPDLLASGGDQLDVVPGAGGSLNSVPDGALARVPPPRTCSTYTGAVSPIGIAGGTHHYFNWNGPKVLVGVSADTGCHLFLNDQTNCRSGAFDQNNNPDSSKSNYQKVLDDAKIAGINKIRLWVSLTGESHPVNVPFLYDAAGYWHLDQQNPGFFTRLVAVVNYAQARNLAVEVTFFSPHQGGDFTQGAWYRHTRGGASLVGFTASENFVIANDTRLPAAEQNMTQYQINVINWTVQALWCYDNVYWEIANEPDSRGSGGKIGNPDSVAAWENAMVTAVRNAEANALPAGTVKPKHLIAVQPFTDGDLNPFLPSTSASPVNIINGHYVTVNTSPIAVVPSGFNLSTQPLAWGSLSLLQKNYAKPMIFGFNETAITPYGGDRGTKSHLNFKTVGPTNSVQWGTVEPARAEALEFLFGQGAAYDHLGYLGTVSESTPPVPAPVPPYPNSPIRRYVWNVSNFFNARHFDLPLQLTDFQAMSNDPSAAAYSAWNAWFVPGSAGPPKVPPSNADYRTWEAATWSYRFWAALTTNPGVAPKALLFYIHHSTSRCKVPGDYGTGGTTGCVGGQNLSFNSYDARLTNPPAYQESLQLVPGTYDVTWIDPQTFQAVASPQTQTCPPSCGLQSPRYKFDILLKLVKH